jgi:TolB protein
MRRRIIASILSVAVPLISTFVAGEPAHATLPGENGRIAYSTDALPDMGLGSSQIYTVRPDGTGQVQLTHEPDGVNAHRAAWSPDGRRILFNRETEDSAEIWIMNRDGSDQHRLVQDPGYVDFDSTWAPDGGTIAFSRCPVTFGNCGIAIANADGTRIKTIVDDNWFAGTPRYSPDGRRIVFDSDRGGFLDAIWVVNRNGGGLKRVTPPSLEGFYPDWSPDGEHIVFTDNCCRFPSNVWTVRPDGSDLTELTNFPPGHQGGFARYSPDGRKIVLIADLRYPDNCCADLYVMNADGSALHPVVIDQPGLFFADWGPKVAP